MSGSDLFEVTPCVQQVDVSRALLVAVGEDFPCHICVANPRLQSRQRQPAAQQEHSSRATCETGGKSLIPVRVVWV